MRDAIAAAAGRALPPARARERRTGADGGRPEPSCRAQPIARRGRVAAPAFAPVDGGARARLRLVRQRPRRPRPVDRHRRRLCGRPRRARCVDVGRPAAGICPRIGGDRARRAAAVAGGGRLCALGAGRVPRPALAAGRCSPRRCRAHGRRRVGDPALCLRRRRSGEIRPGRGPPAHGRTRLRGHALGRALFGLAASWRCARADARRRGLDRRRAHLPHWRGTLATWEPTSASAHAPFA